MLQDPTKGVLVPLSPEEARGGPASDLGFVPQPRHTGAGWSGLADVTARSGEAELPLAVILATIPALPDPSEVSYDRAYAAMIGGDHATAASRFAAAAFLGEAAAPALYGLALAMEELGQHEMAEALAAFVSDLPGYLDPRAAALAGYAAFQRRQSKAARVHLAKAARLARLQPEFRSVQRFAQRVLLMQQFALGD